MTDARALYASHLEVDCESSQFKRNTLKALADTLAAERTAESGLPVVLSYKRDDAQGPLRLGDDWRIRASDELIIALKEQFGNDRVRLRFDR